MCVCVCCLCFDGKPIKETFKLQHDGFLRFIEEERMFNKKRTGYFEFEYSSTESCQGFSRFKLEKQIDFESSRVESSQV